MVLIVDGVMCFKVGLAAFDFRTAKLHLSQFIESSRSYQNTATLLQYFDPADIITPSNMIEPPGIIGLISVVNQCASASKVCLFAFELSRRTF